jgi:hypothetical protein
MQKDNETKVSELQKSNQTLANELREAKEREEEYIYVL